MNALCSAGSKGFVFVNFQARKKKEEEYCIVRRTGYQQVKNNF